MSMCRVFSCVVGRGCLLWPMHFIGKTLLVFALLHSTFQSQICLYARCFLTSYFCIPVPYIEKDIFFWVLVLKGLVFLYKTVQLQFLQRYWLGHRLGKPHAQAKRNPSKMVSVARGHQRADTLKPYSQETSQSNHTRTTALSNSMKLSHALWGHPR